MQVNVFTATVAIIVLVIISIAGLKIVRRKIDSEQLASHHDVTDPLSQVVGMMFAILLGFMVGDAMQRFEAARQTVQQEAASVVDAFRLSEGLPNAQRDQIRALCIKYVDAVVNDEWQRMADKKTSNAAWKHYGDLWSTCTKFQPKTQGESNIQQTILPVLITLGDSRRMRVEAMNNGLPPILWVVLAIGGCATILFTFFFGGNLRIQVIMTGLITVLIGLNIFLLASYDDPFSGDVMVAPNAFVVDQRLFRTQVDLKDPYETDQ